MWFFTEIFLNLFEKSGIAPICGAIPYMKNVSFLDSGRILSALAIINSCLFHKTKSICKTKAEF